MTIIDAIKKGLKAAGVNEKIRCKGSETLQNRKGGGY